MKCILLLSTALFTVPLQAAETWRFLLLADWHSAEKYTQREKNPAWLGSAVAEDVAAVRMLKTNYGGELILMPGDSNGGHWDTPAFITRNYPVVMGTLYLFTLLGLLAKLLTDISYVLVDPRIQFESVGNR